IAITPPAMQTNVDTRMIVTMISDPYLHDLLDHQHAEHLHDGGDGEQPVATRVTPHHIHVTRIHKRHVDREEDRESTEQPRRPARAEGHRFQVFHDAEAFANRVGDFLEKLGKITAGLSLDQDGGYAHPKIENGDAFNEVLERELQRQSEVLLFVSLETPSQS